MSGAWNIFVIVLVASNILGCVWLLWYTSKRRGNQHAANDTGHVWDGDITEYNKPLPRWWIILFYLTIVFSIAYVAWYGGLGSIQGKAGWSSEREHAAASEEASARLGAALARFEGQPLPALAGDADALRLGGAVFANHCATCHGSDARGAKGFPNLANDHWQWGGEPERVLETVLGGRTAVMPPMAQVLGGDQGVTEVAVYVQQLAGHRVDTGLAARGKARFEMVCAACHGAGGTGNPMLGAPNLTDAEWLYGGDFDTLRTSIAQGRNGQMPAHAPIIGEQRARLVAAYVLSLSGNATAANAQAAPGAPAAGAAAAASAGAR